EIESIVVLLSPSVARTGLGIKLDQRPNRDSRSRDESMNAPVRVRRRDFRILDYDEMVPINNQHVLPQHLVLTAVRLVAGGMTPRSINLRGENPQSRRDAELSPFLISNLKKPRSNIFTDRVRIVAVSFLGEPLRVHDNALNHLSLDHPDEIGR